MQHDRSKFIGGSDVAAILGLNPYKTPLAVWAEKTGRVKPEDISDKGAVLWGNLLETLIARQWAKASGVKLSKNRSKKVRQIRGHSRPWLAGEIDFWTEDGLFLEVKTAGVRRSKEWGPTGSAEIPVEYYCQVQHYMFMAEVTWCHVAVLIGGQDFRVYAIEYDGDFYQAAFQILDRFWIDNVLGDHMPDISPKSGDNALLADIYPNASSGTVLATPEDMATYAHLVDLKEIVKNAGEEIEELEASLKMNMREADTLVDETGNILATWRQHERKTIKWDKIAKQLGYSTAMLERYTQKTSYRSFLLKKPQGDQDD